MLFDTHAHYDDEWFGDEAYELLSSMPENNVGYIINACTKTEDIPHLIKMCEKYPFMYTTIGIYPHSTVGVGERDMEILKEYSSHPKVVAIGEIGLDYYYDTAPRDVQQYWLGRQIDIANEAGLPVVIHDREAHGDVLRILREHNVLSGEFHCYSGSVEMSREVLDLGMYIAFGGSLTFKNAVKTVEAAKVIPDDRILIETDAPYLAPVPMRGKRNSSLYIHYVAEKLAHIRNTTVQHIEDITCQNARNLFKI